MTKIHLSEDTWARAREDYLAGMTGEQVCRRYGMGMRTLREHAEEERWRRSDHPDAPPVDDDADMSIFADLETIDLLEQARLHAAAAVMRGRSVEAARWTRLTQALQARLEAETREDEDDRAESLMIAAERIARGLPVRDHDLAFEDDPYCQNAAAAAQEGVDRDERWLRLYGRVPMGPPYDMPALEAAQARRATMAVPSPTTTSAPRSATPRSATPFKPSRKRAPHSPHPEFSAAAPAALAAALGGATTAFPPAFPPP